MTRYEEIADDLRERIARGEYQPGTRLPPYSDLQDEYHTGAPTVRSAIQLLKSEGLVVSRGSGGLVVRGPAPRRRRLHRGHVIMRNPRFGYVFPSAADAGEPWQTHGSPVASLEPVPAEIAELFEVEPGLLVARRLRVTSPEGEPPFQVLATWIDPEAAREAPQVAAKETGPGGYLDRLEQAGHGPISWIETARVRMPTRDEARLLEIPEILPVFVLTRVGTSARTSRPVEISVAVIPGDRVEMVTKLVRGPSAKWPVSPVE